MKATTILRDIPVERIAVLQSIVWNVHAYRQPTTGRRSTAASSSQLWAVADTVECAMAGQITG